ncbi:glycoside hydrolase family 130 protein [Compostibacter hankyongensis]|uniref:Glycoside hydrolase family 130 protein n=1 Tax=Compostibacter hankyongensis TaxID=1007089 RepID=A0ABP8FNL9_9BACT
MQLTVTRKTARADPDSARVIARFFLLEPNRTRSIIQQVLDLPDEAVAHQFSQVLREFSGRHRNITRIFEKHCGRARGSFAELGVDYASVDIRRRLLIGSYFTLEYSVESSAFFNPSMVKDIDQTALEEGQCRVILSFRAVGEGHISSIVFRRAIIDAQHNIHLHKTTHYIDEPEIYRDTLYDKSTFFHKASSIHLPREIHQQITEALPEEFEYEALKKQIRTLQEQHNDDLTLKDSLERVLWLANSHYEMHFSLDTDISDRVIFPYSEAEKKGIEDARFVRFTDDDGEVAYYATYTAYDGVAIQPELMETRDFYHFKTMPLYGYGAQNKNLALFPRKINGKYAMLSRIDGINNYIMYSDNINVWEQPIRIQEPVSPWEFVQVGNCGSPIETEHGWLLITHGVGPMRRYCLGAALLRLDDPSVEIGRLKEPLLTPSEAEREGYVPNVVYSCGSMLHNGELIIPYGMSDYASTFATIPLERLIRAILQG